MNREEFYKNTKILFEIIKQCKERELVFLQKGKHNTLNEFAVRQINARSINVINQNFDRFDFYNLPLNIYYSLAKFKFIPFASFNMQERKQQYKEWNKQWINEIIGFDFAFDFDGKPEMINEVHKATKVLKDFLDKHNQPYTLAFSGNKGFHIEIPQENLPKFTSMDQCINAYHYITQQIKEKLGLTSVNEGGYFDDTITDLRRIFKMKYSWDSSSNLICLPLSDHQFDNFSKDICTPENVINLGWTLGRRGKLCRNEQSKFNLELFDSL